MSKDKAIRCPFCIDGEWFKSKDYKEPYGDMYRPAKIACGVCNGSKAILESEIKNHPDKQQITEEERKKLLIKLQEKKK